MYEDKRTILEQLRREVEGLGRHSDHPHAAELEYHLTRLSTALNAARFNSHSFDLYAHRVRPELLAHIDAVMAQSREILEAAAHASAPTPTAGRQGTRLH